jgi:hypothetical protein
MKKKPLLEFLSAYLFITAAKLGSFLSMGEGANTPPITI